MSGMKNIDHWSIDQQRRNWPVMYWMCIFLGVEFCRVIISFILSTWKVDHSSLRKWGRGDSVISSTKHPFKRANRRKDWLSIFCVLLNIVSELKFYVPISIAKYIFVTPLQTSKIGLYYGDTDATLTEKEGKYHYNVSFVAGKRSIILKLFPSSVQHNYYQCIVVKENIVSSFKCHSTMTP